MPAWEHPTEIVGADFCKFYSFDGYNDMNLCEIGSNQCAPGYGYGPLVRRQNIFHYVLSGRGELTINDKKYKIGPHQGFLIPDEVLAYYQADYDDPWCYEWIHLDGPKANEAFAMAGLSKTQPIFTPESESEQFEKMFIDLFSNCDKEYYCMGKSYEILDFIATHSSKRVETTANRQLEYVRQIVRYIQTKYYERLRVEDIASLFGLNRSYMARLFREATGRTVQDYMLTCRMNEAKRRLTSTEDTVQYIAYAVGYTDSFTFSKAFKRFTGLSPSEFRDQAVSSANSQT